MGKTIKAIIWVLFFITTETLSIGDSLSNEFFDFNNHNC